MNSILKKALAISMIATLSLSVFAGCSSDSSSDTSSDSSTDTSTDTDTDTDTDDSAASGEVETITFWNWGTDTPDSTMWAYAVDNFNANEGVELGYEVVQTSIVNDTYKDQLVIAMAAGECPDMYNHWSGGPMNEYVDAGLAQDLTSYYEEYGIEDLFMDAAIEQATYNDSIYAMPLANCSVGLIFYNTEIFADLGLEEPDTITELEAICDTLVDNDYVPFALANSSQWTGSFFYMYFATRYGGTDPFNDAVSGEGSFEDDAFIYAGEKIQEWVSAGYFPDGVNGLSEDNGDSRTMLYTDQAAMTLMGSWLVSTVMNESEEYLAKMGVFEFPEYEDSDADQSLLVGTIGDTFVSFSCTGDKLDAAFTCAMYWTTDEYMELCVESGKISPLVSGYAEQELNIEITEMLNASGGVQLWYDQYLSSEVAEVHKSESQKLFDFSATPEEVAAAQQAAIEEYLA